MIAITQRFRRPTRRPAPSRFRTSFCSACGQWVPKRGKVIADGSYGGYRIRIYRKPPERSLSEDSPFSERYEIFHQQQSIFLSKTFLHYSYGRCTKNDSPCETRLADYWLTMGRDLIGDGQPNLVVWRIDSGNACDVEAEIFTLGRRLQKDDTVSLEGWGDTKKDAFVDLDCDGYPEIVVWTSLFFEHLHHRCQPRTKVVLKYRESRFRSDWPQLKL